MAGNLLQLFLYVNGVPSQQSYHAAVAGKNLVSSTFRILGDGRTYAIGMRHNGINSKGVTTFGNATMTVSVNE